MNLKLPHYQYLPLLQCLANLFSSNFQNIRDSALHSLEKAISTHSSILAWKIPWTEESGEPQSMGLQSVRHD